MIKRPLGDIPQNAFHSTWRDNGNVAASSKTHSSRTRVSFRVARCDNAEEDILRYLKYYPTLQALNIQLLSMHTLVIEGLQAVLNAGIEFTHADKGNMQVVNPLTHGLKIVVQNGFDDDFMTSLSEVRTGTACALARATRKPVVVTDIARSDIFDATALAALRAANIRAVICVPILTNGDCIGVLSVHFHKRYKRRQRDMILLGLLVAQTAVYIERSHGVHQMDMVLSELEHRNNNLLAIIQAVSKQSPDRGIFEQRLATLARTNHQLTSNQWEGLSIDQTVRAELGMWLDRVSIDGDPSIILSPKDAQNFSLAIHELATNAVKYGALRTSHGHIDVRWTGNGIIHFMWRERDGPPVEPPATIGFGTRLLRFGRARLNYDVEGVEWNIELPRVDNGHGDLLKHGWRPGRRRGNISPAVHGAPPSI